MSAVTLAPVAAALCGHSPDRAGRLPWHWPLAALRQLAPRWQAAALTQPPQRHRSGGQVHDGEKDRERVVVALPGHS